MWKMIFGIGAGIVMVVANLFVLPRMFQGLGPMPRDYPRQRDDAEYGDEDDTEHRDPA